MKGAQPGLKRILEKLTVDETQLLMGLIFRDPFAGLYRKALPIYAVILVMVVLWPYDFDFTGRVNHVKWITAPDGIGLTKEGQVISRSSTKPLFERLVQGSGLSLELWCAPANTVQDGPAVIVSYSQGQRLRNFTVGQTGKDLIVRLRTERTNLNGMYPHLRVKDVFPDSAVLHLVITYDYSAQEVYVNGQRRTHSEIPGGRFTNWDAGHRLALGNDVTGDLSWSGKLFYVAVYDRPLSKEEVKQGYLHGKGWLSGGAKDATVRRDAVVQYLFDEGRGDAVKDSGSLNEPLDLHIPEKIEATGEPFLEFSWNRIKSRNPGTRIEMILNVLLFIPFGFLLYAVLAGHVENRLANVLIVLVAGMTATLSVEMLQYFSQSRHSSMNDVAANMAGVVMGILLKWGYDRFLNPFHRAKRGSGTEDRP